LHSQNCQAHPFLNELAEAQPLPEWLEAEVAREMEDDSVENPLEDVIVLSKLLSMPASRYRSMWAFGNHLRVSSVEAHLCTYDSGVFASSRVHAG
jgi:hypothetical protein